MYFSLNGDNWRLKGWLPYNYKFIRESGIDFELPYFMEWIRAEVPGSIHRDLIKGGIIKDPYYEDNALKCEWVENKWWQYQKSFCVPEAIKGKKAVLVFKGIDYKASIYFNGKKLGDHENMFTAVKYDITDIIKFHGENVLDVSIENVPEDQPQIGYTSKSKHQKSRFGYSWDFCTRLNNMGLWQDVGIKFYDHCLLEDIHVNTDVIDSKGLVRVSGKVKSEGKLCDSKVEIGLYKDQIKLYEKEIGIHNHEGDNIFEEDIVVNNPFLWYPNGIGEQELYNLKIEIYYNGSLEDEKEMSIGIRKLEYATNDGAPENAMPYTVVINGEKIYVKGVNFVPLDHMYGAVTDEEYEYYIMAAKSANINLIRVWGGGIIEKEIFYELCDKHGIMIWQEFTQSNSGLDGIPSTLEVFMDKLKDTAVEALKVKRNHVSLVFWGGGNELKKDDNRTPVDLSNRNIKMLKELVEKYDPQRLFYYSCPNGPLHGLSIDKKDLEEKKNHNIHGPWKYSGIEKHYELFNKSNSLYHGEFGANGCSSTKTLVKFLSEKNVVPTDMSNFIWRFHNASWWDSYARDVSIFSKICTRDMDTFTICSQFIQAESIRYSLEANRRRKYQNSGSIIWQLNEPWPNVDCTNLIDYYRYPKMAYYWVKKAYESVHVSLKYWTLLHKKGEEFNGEVHLNNTGDSLGGQYLVEVLTPNGKKLYVMKAWAQIGANSVSNLIKLNFKVDENFPDIFFVRIKFFNETVEFSENIYIFSTKDEEIFKPLLNLNSGNIEVKITERETSTLLTLNNTGSEVCLFTNISDNKQNCQMYYSDNFVTLFPKESKEIIMQPVNKSQDKSKQVKFDVHWLNKNQLL